MFKKRRPTSGNMELQITSMADVFTILLVFLLKSFSAGAMQITPSAGLKLPLALAAPSHFEALRIEISPTQVSFEGEPAQDLVQSRAPASVLNSDGAFIALTEKFKVARERQMEIARLNPDVQADPKVVIIADRGTPYRTIQAVLASAATHGYTDFKLAVVAGD